MSANHSIMKTIEISIIAFLMSLTFASCIKDIEFSGEQTESKLVMIGLQYVGGTPQLLVHHSLFFLHVGHLMQDLTFLPSIGQ